VEDHLIARLKLVQTRAEVLCARALGEPHGLEAVARYLRPIIQVAHVRSVRPVRSGVIPITGTGERRVAF
jgi:hypothetical protein